MRALTITAMLTLAALAALASAHAGTHKEEDMHLALLDTEAGVLEGQGLVAEALQAAPQRRLLSGKKTSKKTAKKTKKKTSKTTVKSYPKGYYLPWANPLILRSIKEDKYYVYTNPKTKVIRYKQLVLPAGTILTLDWGVRANIIKHSAIHSVRIGLKPCTGKTIIAKPSKYGKATYKVKKGTRYLWDGVGHNCKDQKFYIKVKGV